MATYVLVHGAFHGSWCWERVLPYLENAGHHIYTPTLTGLGERAHELSPEVGLDTHIGDVVGLLTQLDLREVILVGHSYGGLVVTGALDRAPERVAHVVYLDSCVPRSGESMASIMPLLMFLQLLHTNTRESGDGWKIAPPNGKSLFGVSGEPERNWLRTQLTPQPLKTFEQPLCLKNPDIVASTPRTAIYCSGGELVFKVLRHLIARRSLPPTEAGWRLRMLPTGHDAMILQPKALADVLLEAAHAPPRDGVSQPLITPWRSSSRA